MTIYTAQSEGAEHLTAYNADGFRLKNVFYVNTETGEVHQWYQGEIYKCKVPGVYVVDDRENR